MPNITDYLHATARIRSLELSLLNDEKMERMLSARSDEEAFKILNECGYGDVSIFSPAEIEKLISTQRQQVFNLLHDISADKSIADIIKVKFDYHNIKVIIKARNAEYKALLIDSGRVNVNILEEAIRQSSFSNLNTIMTNAIIEARDVLYRTNDPQLSDFILDNAAFADMMKSALETQSEFILQYVKLLIDITNLRSFIRCGRMGKGSSFMKQAIIEGGDIIASKLIDAAEDGVFKAEGIYTLTQLENAATVGDAALHRKKPFTMFEKTCDDTLMKYIQNAKFIPFGKEPLFAYLIAKETEYMSIRTILLGRFAHLEIDTIRERLRNAYV